MVFDSHFLLLSILTELLHFLAYIADILKIDCNPIFSISHMLFVSQLPKDFFIKICGFDKLSWSMFLG